MNILTMLWKNLWGGYRTLLFPARPKVSERYRGLVQFDPELCTGCAICRFRCTARAIEFKPGKGEFVWSYDPGQCTFCGRCVEGCKTPCPEPGRRLPAHLSERWRAEEDLHVAPQTACSQAGRAQRRSRPLAGANAQPRYWRRAMTLLETISEKLGIAKSVGRKRRRALA